MRTVAHVDARSERVLTQQAGAPPLGLLALLALPFCIALGVITGDNGLALSADSIAHLNAAENVASGNGLVLNVALPPLEPFSEGAATYDYVHYPPLYPVIVGGLSALLGDTAEVARWFQVLVLGANIVLIGAIVWKLTGSRIAALAAGALFGLSPAGLESHAAIGYEPLFFTAALAALLLLAQYLESGRSRLLVLSGVATATALLVKYAGPPLLGAEVLALLLWSPGPFRTRLLRAAAFGAACAAPLVAWLARNQSVAGTGSGREPRWHPPSRQNIEDGINDLTTWFAPSFLPPGVRLLVVALMLGALVWVAASGARRIDVRGAAESLVNRRGDYLAPILGVFALLFVASAIASQYVFDALTPLKSRLLIPALIVGLALLARWLWRDALGTRTARVVAVLVAGTLLVTYVYDLSDNVADVGIDYGSDSWKASPTLAQLRAVPESQVIYSNAPEAVEVLTGREARSLPVVTDPVIARANPRYGAELEGLERDVAAGRAYVAFFEEVETRDYVMPESELEDAGLRLVETTADGRLYRSSQ